MVLDSIAVEKKISRTEGRVGQHPLPLFTYSICSMKSVHQYSLAIGALTLLASEKSVNCLSSD